MSAIQDYIKSKIKRLTAKLKKAKAPKERINIKKDIEKFEKRLHSINKLAA